MPISIQTNFDVSTNYPIDSRLVATDSTARDAISYKYIGLKVYDLSDGLTYVWSTGDIWKIDGVGGLNGIYSGSGSIPTNVGISLGTVSNNLDDRSNELYKYSTTLLGNKSYIYDYFYRRQAGDDYDTVAFRTEHKLNDGTLQGPFIEFNGKEPIYSDIVGSLVLGVPSSTGNTKGAKLVLTPKNYFAFYTSDDPSTEAPLTIGKFNNQTYLGFNFNPLTTATNNTFNNAQNSYRMKFGRSVGQDELTFETKLANNSNWREVLKIQNLDTTTTNVVSPIKFLIDNSGRDWDGLSTRTYNLLNISEIVRDSENRFTKTQMWAQGTYRPTGGTGYWIIGGILFLNLDGNSFTVPLNANSYFQDIRTIRGGGGGAIALDYPNGTILTIKFINLNSTQPGYIQLMDESGTNSSKIYSDVNDSLFYGNDKTKLTIDYTSVAGNFGNKSESGDIIVFRKMSGYWEIVNVNRNRKMNTKIGGTGTANTWEYQTPRFLKPTLPTLPFYTSSSSFQLFSNSTLSTVGSLSQASSGNAPNKFNYGNGGQIGVSRDTTNFENFKFRILADGTKTVSAQGNFRILIPQKDARTRPLNVTTQTASTLTGLGSDQNFFWKQQKVENIICIGKINNVGLIPEFESVWQFVSGYASEGSNVLTLSSPIISISRTGHIYFNFKVETSKTISSWIDWGVTSDIIIDVWVPPFSYTAASVIST